MKPGVFITGTNTGIGKTFISSLLVAAALKAQLDIRYYKPIQTGADHDTATLKKLTQCPDFVIKQPCYTFKLPAAPSIAADAENTCIDPTMILKEWQNSAFIPHIIEGAGGVLVPITKNFLMRDLIQALQIPVIVVAATVLGTINHTLLTLESLQLQKIPIKGIILSGHPAFALKKTLEEFSSVKILAEVPWFGDFDNLDAKAAAIFDKKLLEKIFYE